MSENKQSGTASLKSKCQTVRKIDENSVYGVIHSLQTWKTGHEAPRFLPNPSQGGRVLCLL
jgi:hypothetical protein